MKALIHASLFDFDTYRQDCYLLFDDRIQSVGPMADFPGAQEVFDCSGGVVMPGLLAGHTHIYSTFSRGWNTLFAPHNFTEILEQLWWKLDAGLDREAVYASGLVSGAEFIKNGVTTVIDHHASGTDIKGTLELLKRAVCDESGLRGIFCFETSDRFPLEQCVEENVEFSSASSKKHAGLFGMHASMTLSDSSLAYIAEHSADLPIHIHVAESGEDARDCRSCYGKSIVQRLDSFGLLRSGSLLAHCNHIEAEDFPLIRERGATIAVNPTSNMNNGVDLPDAPEFLKQGIPCILGNDGLGFNMAREMLNLVYTMHHRAQSPTAFSFGELRQMLRFGYGYAGNLLNCRLGRLESGYEADFLFHPYNPPTPMDESNIWGHFFYGMLDAFRPKDVWCGGQLRMTDYVPAVSESAIARNAQSVSKKLWERIS